MTTEEYTPQSISAGLPTAVVGRTIFVHQTLTSTMDEALKLARAGADDGTVVIADTQTAGKGRFDRRWLSESGASILMSVILKPTVDELPNLNMGISLAILRAIRRYPGVRGTIKWPNDIKINDLKLCGTLLDSYFDKSKLEFSIAGIGLNVNLDTSKYSDISRLATSLSTITGTEVSRLKVLQCLLEELDVNYREAKQNVSFFSEWRSNISTLGQQVSVKTGGKTMSGVAEGVNEQGELLLRGTDGMVHNLNSGEVSLNVN